MSMRQMSRFLLSSSQPNTLRILAQNSMKRPIFVKDLLDDLGGGELLDSDTAKRLSGVSLWCSRPRKRWKTTGAKTRGYIAAAPFVIQRVKREHRDLFLFVDYSQEIQLETGRLSCVCWMYSTARLAASTHTGQITGNPPDEKANCGGCIYIPASQQQHSPGPFIALPARAFLLFKLLALPSYTHTHRTRIAQSQKGLCRMAPHTLYDATLSTEPRCFSDVLLA
jgi:hypothetical protein